MRKCQVGMHLLNNFIKELFVRMLLVCHSVQRGEDDSVLPLPPGMVLGSSENVIHPGAVLVLMSCH